METKPVAKYLQAQAARTRFSFGKVWTATVLEGNVKDHAKLVAHAVHLKAGKKSDLKRLKFETLLSKVQSKVVQVA